MENKENPTKEEGVVVGLLEVKMRTRRRMRMQVPTETKEMRVSTAPKI
jgi:hypothetical protein